jgi:hypothetical protein
LAPWAAAAFDKHLGNLAEIVDHQAETSALEGATTICAARARQLPWTPARARRSSTGNGADTSGSRMPGAPERRATTPATSIASTTSLAQAAYHCDR